MLICWTLLVSFLVLSTAKNPAQSYSRSRTPIKSSSQSRPLALTTGKTSAQIRPRDRTQIKSSTQSHPYVEYTPAQIAKNSTQSYQNTPEADEDETQSYLQTPITDATQSYSYSAAPTTTGINTCQPNPQLSAVLLQMLISSLKQPIQQQQQPKQQQQQDKQSYDQQQFQFLPELNSFNLDLNDVQPTPTIQTKIVTSSIVSTITQTLSRVVSIWFRNVRIPTTIFSKTQQVVTDYITVTSTLGVEPTLVREKREQDTTHIDSSLVEEESPAILLPTKTPALLNSHIHFNLLVKQPKVLKAWNQFVLALEEATHKSSTEL